MATGLFSGGLTGPLQQRVGREEAIDQFLSELLGCELQQIPAFERGPDVMKFLDEFRTHVLQRTALGKIVEQQAWVQAEEYAAESEFFNARLTRSGLQASHLLF